MPGGVPEFLKKLDGRIGAVHLIDSDGTLDQNETSTHRPFGDGFLDFHILAPQLLDVKDVGWWCVDLGGWPGAWDLVEPSLNFVQDLIEAKSAA